MAKNLKVVDWESSKVSRRSTSSSENHASKTESVQSSFWHLQLNFGHVVVFWSVMAGTLVAGFLMGLFAGRTQGVEKALREQSDISLRLPLSGKADHEANNQARASLGPKILNTLKKDSSLDRPGQGKVDTSTLDKADRRSSLAESEDQLTAGWYVQIVAANARKEAEELESRLIEADLPAVVQKARLKKIEYFRVLSGPFESRVVAVQRRVDIKRLKLSASAPFIRQVY